MTREPGEEDEKPIEWMASSYDDLIALSDEVQDQIGYALDLAQRGKKAAYAKPMHGDILKNVIEIVVDDRTRTYRSMYTTKFGDVVYVLDAFVKKSRIGAQTSQRDEDRIKKRYQAARAHYEKNY